MGNKFSIYLDDKYESFLQSLKNACEHIDNAAYCLKNTDIMEEEVARLNEGLHDILNYSSTQVPRRFVERDEDNAHQVERCLG